MSKRFPVSARAIPDCNGLRLCLLGLSLVLIGQSGHVLAQDLVLAGSIPEFQIEPTDVDLDRLAQPDTYLDKTGRQFALLGTESGQFEAWAWPLKLFTGLNFSFFVRESTTPILARDIVQRVEVRPAVTTITYVYQSFTVQAHVIAAIDEPGAVILLDVDSDHPLRIVAGFFPTMQPMWPAGLGGQYASWIGDVSAYVISESSRQNHGYVGSAAGEGMSYTPAHMLGESPNEFRIDISDPSSVDARFIPVVMAGGKGERAPITEAYKKIAENPQAVYRRAADHYEALLTSTTSIQTPERKLDLAFEWSKISYDNLLADNPDFSGTGLMAGLDQAGGGGRPGFGWFFGGDTYINTLSLNALGMFDTSRESLSFMTQFQRDDGKMAHEVTQAWDYVDWFGDYPYAYIHADTSPWYIVAVHDHYAATGNTGFLQKEWPNVLKTYEWCLSTDVDGDGLMDNEAAGLGALEFGSLTDIRTDVYLAAIWTRALQVLPHLAQEMGEDDLAAEATARSQDASASFEQFWNEESGHYAYAFDRNGNTIGEATPWPSVAVIFGLGSKDRRYATMDRLSRSDMTTDWGIRMLSSASVLFEPLNYNYGAVWPFVTSWATTAHFLSSRPLQGYSSLMSTVQRVYTRSLGDISEVLSGGQHTWPQESVPHQGFAIASTVLPTIRGLFGLWYDAPSNTLVVGPQVPPDWDNYSVKRFAYGNARLDLIVSKSLERDTYFIRGSDETTIRFQPLYPPGTVFHSITVNGRPGSYDVHDERGGRRLDVKERLTDELTIIVHHSGEPAPIPPVWNSPLGSKSNGMRILSYSRLENQAILEVEGLAGKAYDLAFTHVDRIKSVDGADLTGDGLRIVFSESDSSHDTQRLIMQLIN